MGNNIKWTKQMSLFHPHRYTDCGGIYHWRRPT